MSKTIVLEATQVEQGADKPFAMTPAAARNRRIFMKGIAGGAYVYNRTGNLATVTSATRPGHCHHVSRVEVRPGVFGEYCDCEWGTRIGWIFSDHKGNQPCCHILINRFDLMSEDTRAGLLDMDPELAAVAGAYGKTAESVAA